jgi:hypothetical protein
MRRPDEDRRLLAAVLVCPHRGAVLPLSLQPYVAEGCRRCGELSLCAAGKGARPGKVSLEECVRCQWAAGAAESGGGNCASSGSGAGGSTGRAVSAG